MRPSTNPIARIVRSSCSVPKESFALRLDDVVVPVLGILPLPGYLSAVDREGRAVADVAMSHSDRVRLSPIEGCAFDCSFCDMGGRYLPRSPEQIVAALEIALADDALPARHILISGGSPGWALAEQNYFKDACIAVIRRARALSAMRDSPLTVDIMMSARKDGPEFVDRMVEEGVHGFSFNVEVFSEEGGCHPPSPQAQVGSPTACGDARTSSGRVGPGLGSRSVADHPGLGDSRADA